MDKLALSVFNSLAGWSPFATDTWRLNEVVATNLNNTAEIGIKTGNVQGQIGGQAGYTPSGLNVFFKLTRTTTATRNGIRYLNGFPESSVEGNTFVGNAVGIEQWAIWWATTQTMGNDGEYVPVIIRKPRQGVSLGSNRVKGVIFRGLTVMNRRMK
jgi:hypothetical protein